MPDLGISVLLKGQNFMRMLAGQRERLAGTYQEKMHQL